MNSKKVQTCNLINTAANPNSNGIFVTGKQRCASARGQNIVSFKLCFCKRGLCHSTKSQQNDRRVLRTSPKRNSPDRCCSRGEELLNAITADMGIIQLTDNRHEFPACSFAAKLEWFTCISHNFDSGMCS